METIPTPNPRKNHRLDRRLYLPPNLRTRFELRPGLDWAGRVVEAVSVRSLDAFIQMHICEKLRLRATTFRPGKIEGFGGKRVELAVADGESGVLKRGEEPYPLDASDCLGGIGLFTTPRGFTEFLGTLLAGGESILKPESMKEMFSSQIENQDVTEYCNKLLNNPMGESMRMALTTGTRVEQGLSGFKCLNTKEGLRAVRSVSWMGMPNCVWWIDFESGVAASMFCRSFPPVDGVLAGIQEELEVEFYNDCDLEAISLE